MPVARAIADGKPLTPEQVDRFTAQYHDNWLRMRASTIARTEALHAANMGGRLACDCNGPVFPGGQRSPATAARGSISSTRLGRSTASVAGSSTGGPNARCRAPTRRSRSAM